MKRINLLDENTSNKIAAGEVVERPASVVKELVENSIDAGAKNITIEIEEGGIALIKIIDDGNGIHSEDISKAFLPHATSKIKSVEDIYSISTLGFRGEALASIASVAKVNLKSKPKAATTGMEISIEGGVINYIQETGINDGTVMEVRDLFYNVPARLKFLKSSSREGALINDIITRIALSNPDISFKLYNGSKKALQTYGSGKVSDVIRTVYGKTISEQTIYFEDSSDMLTLYGYIGREEIARGSRNNQSIFVNGRYIKNKTLTAAVENAFKSFATVSKFPFFVLFVEVYPEFVDVNIHPTKAEIKFKDDRGLFKKIFDAVHKGFKAEIFNSFAIPEEEYSNSNKANYENNHETIAFNFQDEVSPANTTSTLSNLNPIPNNFTGSDTERDSINYKNLNDVTLNEVQKEEAIYNALRESMVIKEKDLVSIPIDLKSKNTTGGNSNVGNSATDNDTIGNNLRNANINNDPMGNDNYGANTNGNPYVGNIDIGNSNISNNSMGNNSGYNSDISVEKGNDVNNIKTPKFQQLKVIGQFNKTYILAEFDSTLYIIDQHAAHEKILFEKYLKDIENQSIVIQPLLTPVLVHLTLDDLCTYEEFATLFGDAGFIIEDFGGNTLALKEVPYFVGKLDPKNLFLSILDNLKALGSGKTTEVKYNKIASMSCRAAVKANDVLTIREMESLIEDLRHIEDPFHCPHGRPVIVKFTDYELDKKFRRIV